MILTPNTSSYIRKVDAKWCENLEAIAGYNWCKIVFDNLRDAGHEWTLCRRLKKDKPPILGWFIFLIVGYYYDPNTFHLLLGYLQSQQHHFHSIKYYYIHNLLSQIYYLDNLMIQNGLDPLTTPRCSVSTTDIIRAMQNADHRKPGSGVTRYKGAKVSSYKLPTLQFQQTTLPGHIYKLVCSYDLLLILHNGYNTCF
jgi:hypothetical protein